MDRPNRQYQNTKLPKRLVARLSSDAPQGGYQLQLKHDYPQQLPFITGQKAINHSQSLKGNIENFVGYAQVPIGVAGPLLIHGDFAHGQFDIPMATTEGALVASYNRGMKACRRVGGIATLCDEDVMIRAPYFEFRNLRKARSFIHWATDQRNIFEQLVMSTSNHCLLNRIEFIQQGKGVIMELSFQTGDAAGQNMVTLAADAIYNHVLEQYNDQPVKSYIESNYSGDKKPNYKSLSRTRGKKVIAEVILPKSIVSSVLKSTPEAMCQYFLSSTLASAQAGSIGNTGHVANALTAIFIACGQDVACVAESSVGILRMELTPDADLYASLTLPSLVVGTIGGGTQLATQAEALELMDCKGTGKAKKFAELCCATSLAGELSIAAAIAEDHFTKAHKILGRK